MTIGNPDANILHVMDTSHSTAGPDYVPPTNYRGVVYVKNGVWRPLASVLRQLFRLYGIKLLASAYDATALAILQDDVVISEPDYDISG